MINKACSVVFLAVFALAGCASQAESEPTATHDDAIIGALTSPIGLQDRHMVGTWAPIDGAHFHGKANAIHFSLDRGQASYTMGDAPCAAPCRGGGSWYVSQNPIVWFFAGTYVQFQPRGSQDSSLFVSRGIDGVIRLVDIDSWDWQLGRYADSWERTPALTVDDLWR